MAPERKFCLCCSQWLTAKREREHRKRAAGVNLFNQSGDDPDLQARVAGRSRRSRLAVIEISDVESEESEGVLDGMEEHGMEGVLEGTSFEGRNEPEIGFDEPEEGRMLLDDTSELIDIAVTTPPLTAEPVAGDDDLLRHRWGPGIWREARVDDYDEEDSGDENNEDQDWGPIEDGDSDSETDFVDWDALAKQCELSAWDRLGEDYETRAAEIAEKLTSYDRAICRAFSYKVQTHTTDEAYAKIPYAFPSEPPLPKIDALRSRVSFLAGFKPELYDCCPNSCCCYVGPHKDLSKCPFCKEERYRTDGKTARKKFTYIPLVPRLIALARNEEAASKMQYRDNFTHPKPGVTKDAQEPGITKDVFDGQHYLNLCRKMVEINGKKLGHKYFSDPRDGALGLSTDGFAPFKRRKNTAWPLIIFLYNLPPDIRFHLENILSLGVIPGPKKPKDFDSFLWPLVQELLRLAHGLRAYDILTKQLFILRAYLIFAFGDIPAISMVMRMKGHNAISPCRMCRIQGLQVPGSRATTHYVPLDQNPHPDVRRSQTRTKRYDPSNLPLRTQDELIAQAAEVDSATTNAHADQLAKMYGIKGTPLLAYLLSLSFPQSFPYDFMHLIWENLIKNLLLLWTGEFKGLDEGKECYELSKAVWEAIGLGTAASGSTIPSAYGRCVPNIALDRSNCSAEMWSFWTLYLGPVLLHNRFRKAKYYNHFVALVRLLNICLQFEITDKQIEEVRVGFVEWVEEYENIYYQHNVNRLSACPLTVHALLHIADSIKFAGPVWCYWAFPMERYCGTLQPAIRSRRFPYASLDRYVIEVSQLTQLKAFYGASLSKELSLCASRSATPDPSCILLPPKSKEPVLLPAGVMAAVAGELSRCFRIPTSDMRKHLKEANITEWGKVRRVDSDEGDTIRSSSIGMAAKDGRDATFIRYEVIVERLAHRELLTLYGQLQHIFHIIWAEGCTDARINPKTSIILAGIRQCTLEKDKHELKGLDIHFYTKMGILDFVDITSVQALVGCVKSDVQGGNWAIIDRSGSLARAVYVGDDE